MLLNQHFNNFSSIITALILKKKRPTWLIYSKIMLLNPDFKHLVAHFRIMTTFSERKTLFQQKKLRKMRSRFIK